MQIINNITEMSDISGSIITQGLSMGFVPTMGYLHQGHISLMKEAVRQADKVTASIFVNPAQFGPNEDLDQYPRNLKRDIELAEAAGVDFLFTPAADDLYPGDYQTWINVEKLSQGLCGASRPGHFRGVATIVAKLFNMVRPDIAVFGMKDFQQLQVIKQMVKDLNMPVKVIGHPIVREPDGLAMSSRNKYLSAEQRKTALCLIESLNIAEEFLKKGERSVKKIKRLIKDNINSYNDTRIDYIFIGNPDNLKEFEDQINANTLIALAVYVGTTRLIDNKLISQQHPGHLDNLPSKGRK